MSFVMIAARKGSRVHTLSARRIAAAAALAALTLLVAGGSAGYWIAAQTTRGAEPPLAQAVVDAPTQLFTLEQLGALSGRLFRLESQATQLGQRMGLQPADQASAPQRRGAGTRPAEERTAPGAGGPLLQAQPLALPGLDEAGTLDEQLERLDRHIARVSDAVALRQADLLRLPSRWPVAEGDLVSPFGNRRDPFTQAHAFHAGVDFSAPAGTPILAAAGGRVDVAGPRPEFGLTVEIDHGNGLRTRYAHASALLVRTGEVVAPGELIARVGSTGRSTGPHLHFEVLKGGVPVDPRRYLGQRDPGPRTFAQR